jgi:hypothetical protein
MLRAVLIVLLLANALVYGWTQGWFAPLVPSPEMAEREPQRLAAQVNPDAVSVLPEGAASAAMQAVRTAGLRCLEAGPFSDSEAGGAEAVLGAADLPAGAWQRDVQRAAPSYIVFAGRYPEQGARSARAAELRRLKLNYETLAEPEELAPGFLISRHASREEAERALAALRRLPIQNVRVATLPAGPPQVWLRVPRADAALRARLQAIAASEPALGAGGFKACAAAP